MDCRKTQNGKQAGDPAKLAHALVVIANESQPPRRFLAGANATGLAEQKIAKLREDIESHATSRLHLLSPRTTTACLSGRDDRHVPPTTNSDQTTYRSPCPSSPSASGPDPARRHGTATVLRSARVMLARWRNGVSSSAAHTFAGGSRALSYSLRERDWSRGLASSRPRSCRTGAPLSSPISSGRSSRPLRPRAEAHRRVRQSRVPQRRVLGRRS